MPSQKRRILLVICSCFNSAGYWVASENLKMLLKREYDAVALFLHFTIKTNMFSTFLYTLLSTPNFKTKTSSKKISSVVKFLLLYYFWSAQLNNFWYLEFISIVSSVWDTTIKHLDFLNFLKCLDRVIKNSDIRIIESSEGVETWRLRKIN